VSWQRVRGHEKIVEGFGRLVQRGRLGHAYLFAGPSGIGKRLFAEELGKALLCEGRDDDRFEACDVCPSCKQMDASTHPDFTVVARPEESLEFPIDSIRALSRSFALKSARGKGKVAVLDDADDLNDAAANCFLKTLEEPPPRSLLLLIATNTDLQIPTIVSRCQIVRFQPLGLPLVKELVQAKVEDPQLVERLVRLSDGSPGRAIALADPDLWAFRRTLIGGIAKSPIDGASLARQWIAHVEEAGKESGAQRRRASLGVQFVIEFLEAALILSSGGTPRVVEQQDMADLERLVSRTNPDVLIKALDRCFDASVHINRRVQLVLVLESVVDALASRLN
jgi:DNA polymerase-3 subunit delta'